ncbi:hypothetical protein [Streptomyces collinus]|uniref:hypothetical protein n=1 Tax=Streptomyces collinus TaxID=42684 RepID=UPI0036410C9F
MDVDAAREAIRRQDRLARQELAVVLCRVAAEGDALADAVGPWLGNCWRRTVGSWRDPRALGELKGGAREAVRAAADWAWEEPTTSWSEVKAVLRDLPYHPPSMGSVDNTRHAYGAYEDAHQQRPFKTKRHLEAAVADLHSLMKELARHLREPPREVLPVPEVLHPPRYGSLAKGRLARLVVGDLTAMAEEGDSLEQRLADGRAQWPEALAWIERAGSLLTATLQGFQPFSRAEEGVRMCRSPLVPEPRVLARAHTVLVLSYLREVQALMPDYIEASGQRLPEPQVSMNFSGGTFIGGQFAARISNIHSTVAGIHQEGRTDVAEALRALESAVLADRMDDDRRSDLLDNVEYLTQAAATPPEERNRGLTRAAVAALTTAAAGGSALNAALETWSQVLHKLFG